MLSFKGGSIFIALWNECGLLDQTDLNNGGDQFLRSVEECKRRPLPGGVRLGRPP